ncbi:MAG TPA: polynucleotide adenylyltransferase PcnB [Gammaproteobacteria bacterium]|nr:polynucleotide adenylyltransferase PcnB [Gammaproteobacteria bacterium]
MDSLKIIPRAEHSVSRTNISDNALKVLYRLNNAGYLAFLVGGSVRDLLLGQVPKDFDVATDAHPEQVHDLFRNSRLIGRRFRLVHVRFGREVIEVATFRAAPDSDVDAGADRRLDESGRILRDNVYGTIEEDVWRRDFSVNALYYDIRDFSVWDYVGGLDDLHNRVLRLIGDPATRYREDPVRMLRAVRFAAKHDFAIEPASEAALSELASRLADVPPARLFDEVLKLFMSGQAEKNFRLLRRYGLLAELFPWTEELLAADPVAAGFVERALVNTDRRVAADQPVTPAFLFAALLWAPVHTYARWRESDGVHPTQALRQASIDIASQQQTRVALPRRFTQPMAEIFEMQARFEQRRGKRPMRLLEHPRFRAAYDFLLLRAEAGEAEQELADWWTAFQADHADEEGNAGAGEHRRRRRRRRRVASNNED